MNHHVNTIANRLSLRPPQRESLEILARLCDLLPLQKAGDPAAMLKAVSSEFPTVEDFERDFPSLCFALATGVGKTRLMGAFIAYLHKVENIRHFFVLAPNLTIYDKLIADFTPNTPKYVFQGIAEFAVNTPEIITGDNYESGRGIREAAQRQRVLPGMTMDDAVHVNIFNISKITSIETPTGATKTTVPRFRRLQEYIGESYFEYLSKLDDLVLLMDESHRYRASAGMRAIGELKPILGLELTATPQIERSGGPLPFKNVIYSYPLSSAMEDGFVKEPAVATREKFNARNYNDEQMERLKLEDGVRLHENTKVELEVIRREFERLPATADLAKPEIRKQLIQKVEELVAPKQHELEGIGRKVDIAAVVDKTVALYQELSIGIPKITVQPKGDVRRGYKEFKLDLSKVRIQSVDNEILIQELHKREQHRLSSGDGIVPEQRPEDYLVRVLIDCEDISYDEHSELLYRLAGQAVKHLRSYLKDEAAVVNVLQYHQRVLAGLIHTQMQEHFEEKAAAYEAHVTKGFQTLRPTNYSAPAGEAERDIRAPVSEKQDIPRMLFAGLRKCLYRVQKFDSDPERRFAVVLENDKDVVKWFRPSRGDLQIYYSGEASYEPDFVVEAKAAKFLCEIKRAAEMTDATVLAKARAAAEWCRHAAEHERKHGGKPWSYLLIPDDEVAENKTLQGLAGTYSFGDGNG